MRLLLIEDDLLVAEAIAEALTDELYVVDIVSDGEAGWMQAQVFEYDLILLDVMLPRLDGINLCRRLRDRGNSTPILMLTAGDTTTDKVAGLDAGADDYLVKPIDLPELLARMRAVLRRGSSVSPPIFQRGGLRLDPSTHKVTYNNEPLNLTPKEYSLLELFLRHQQRVLNRRFIIENLWHLQDPPREDTVKAHIKSLRHKLMAVGVESGLIETVYGVGYRLKLQS